MISDEQSNKFYYWLSGHYWNQLSINYRKLKKKSCWKQVKYYSCLAFQTLTHAVNV